MPAVVVNSPCTVSVSRYFPRTKAFRAFTPLPAHTRAVRNALSKRRRITLPPRTNHRRVDEPQQQVARRFLLRAAAQCRNAGNFRDKNAFSLSERPTKPKLNLQEDNGFQQPRGERRRLPGQSPRPRAARPSRRPACGEWVYPPQKHTPFPFHSSPIFAKKYSPLDSSHSLFHIAAAAALGGRRRDERPLPPGWLPTHHASRDGDSMSAPQPHSHTRLPFAINAKRWNTTHSDFCQNDSPPKTKPFAQARSAAARRSSIVRAAAADGGSYSSDEASNNHRRRRRRADESAKNSHGAAPTPRTPGDLHRRAAAAAARALDDALNGLSPQGEDASSSAAASAASRHVDSLEFQYPYPIGDAANAVSPMVGLDELNAAADP
jgi:hypothetical protein